MSITECKGRGIYLVQEEDGFEVHVRLESDVLDKVERFKRIVNEQLSWSGTGIHACMIRHGKMLHFQSSNFTSWKGSEANKVFVNIWNGLTIFEAEIALKRRKCQIRDTFNKCNNLDKIEAIAAILEL